jgi:outer membrane protein OmpA-like peptidoglycan-associated protein
MAHSLLLSIALLIFLTSNREERGEENLMVRYACLILLSWSLVSASLRAQQPAKNETKPADQTQGNNEGSLPVYRIMVVGRTVKAINYRHLSGSSKIDFRSPPLLPQALGTAEVRSQTGATDIDLDSKNLRPATKFGLEYLTYVLWAITPDGRPANLGEVLLNGDRSKPHVTTNLQDFGMILTAEPYFAVTRPSDVVVMENQVRPDTVGKIEEVNAKFELLHRSPYTVNANPVEVTPLIVNSKTPLELFEARNAVRIAKWAGADQYAAGAFAEARQQQAQAEAARAQREAQQAVAEKEQMRARLLQQLNTVLQTRDTQRGLVLTMSDVLFATGKYTLRSEAREKLAKMAGVLLTYANLKLEIDGYTDTTGSASVNQELSKKRAEAVRDYLAQQGVQVSSITPVGMGESNLVVPNDAAAGRKQNRRVDVVITGNAIDARTAATAPVPNP